MAWPELKAETPAAKQKSGDKILVKKIPQRASFCAQGWAELSTTGPVH